MTKGSDEVIDFLASHPQVESIDLLVADLNGIVRGKRIERELLPKVFSQGFNLPGSIMALDATGITVEASELGFYRGDGDNLCRPVPGTLTLQPWHRDKNSGEQNMAQLLCSMFDLDGQAFFADPRQRLVAVVERFKPLGYRPAVALELEFYLLDKSCAEDGSLRSPVSPLSGRRMDSSQVYAMDDLDDFEVFMQDVISCARAQGIPADTMVTENAPGQFEVNLHHCDDLLAAADQALLLKRVIRSVAKLHGMEASFMAKPYIDQPGNGLHIHLSLFDQQGDNIFASEKPLDNDLLSQAVAGVLDLADGTQALTFPSINSFRRLAPGECAPTGKTWGFDNRTVAVRILAGQGRNTRIECRTAGADANPYLAVASLLMGVCEGLQQRMSPPPAVIGNAYQQSHALLADNQRDALRNMQADRRVLDWLGQDFIKVYAATKWHDLHLFDKQITELEYKLLLPYL